MLILHHNPEKKGGAAGMKQLSDKALAKEAAFWGKVTPGKVCHK
jgi:hypothetical protein